MEAIFYSEFDNIAGPQILFQTPKDFLSNEVFDSISDYIIIDTPLCGKIITVSVSNHQIVGYPLCIEDDNYHRNALLFNIGFVFNAGMEIAPYEPIIRKLGSIVESMEKEIGFLSKKESKSTLGLILEKIFHDLTINGESTIPVDQANIINLKVFPTLPEPPLVKDDQVPIAIRDLKMLLNTSAEWDLALQQIIPYVDGVNYVKRISIEADVELAIVKKSLRQLLYYGCIKMIDIFLYTNIYVTTAHLSVLAQDKDLQAECINYVCKNDMMPPNFGKIFTLYCSIQPGLRVCDFCVLYNEALSNIDIRRFISFGLIHSFLRRLHRYPITTYNPSLPVIKNATSSFAVGKRNPNGSRQPEVDNAIEVQKLMDGRHTSDEVCCSCMISYSKLESIVTRDKNCSVVLK